MGSQVGRGCRELDFADTHRDGAAATQTFRVLDARVMEHAGRCGNGLVGQRHAAPDLATRSVQAYGLNCSHTHVGTNVRKPDDSYIAK
jgi:hypothetical protein